MAELSANLDNTGNFPRKIIQIEVRSITGVLGLSFFFAWLFNLFLFSSQYLALFASYSAILVKETFIVAALLAACVVWLIARYSLFNKITGVIFVVFLFLPSLAEILGYLGFLPLEATFATWVLSGVGTSFAFISWGVFLSSYTYEKTVLTPVLGIVVAIATIACNVFVWPQLATFCTMLYPVVSVTLFSVSQRIDNRSMLQEFLSFKNKPALRHLPLVKPMIIAVINSICLGFAFQYLIIPTHAGGSFNVLVLCTVLLLLCIIRIIDILKFKKIGLKFIVLTIVPYISICLLPLSFIDTRFWTWACSIMLGISILNIMINRGLTFRFANSKQDDISPLFFLYDSVGFISGLAIGFFCAWLVFGEQLSDQVFNIYVPSVMVICVVIVWSIVTESGHAYYQTEREEDKNRRPANGDITRIWHRKCADFSSHYHLSPRQQEVLFLLAKGRDANYIKEKLIISSHTAKAHIYNIYRKVDVSSRQELISMIESFDRPFIEEDEKALR
jgi:DNA-binding CsgD family transcriptional regulator